MLNRVTIKRPIQYLLLFISLFLLASCAKIQTTTYTDRIDPLLSVDGSAADPTIFQPYGMVQVTPITQIDVAEKYKAGKYVTDKKDFLGFEHFNLLRSTGNSNHPDLRIGFELKSALNEHPTFDESTELAAVGRYAVLPKFTSNAKDVRTEASVGQFTSLVEFIFPENEQNRIKLEVLASPNTPWEVSRADSFYVKISIQDLAQPLHSLIRLSMFADSITVGNLSLAIGDTLRLNTATETEVKAHYQSADRQKQVLVNSGFSRINAARTESNFELDSQGWWLEGMVAKCKQTWRTHLSKFMVSGGNINDQITFYTLHYRSLRALSLLTESAGFFPEGSTETFGKDLNTDKYAWYAGISPSWATLFWLRSTEAVAVKQLGEDYARSSLRIPIPQAFSALAIELEELNLDGKNAAIDTLLLNSKVSKQLLALTGLSVSPLNKAEVSFSALPFSSFTMHIGGNAYYRRTVENAGMGTDHSLSLLLWLDNGFTF